MRPLSDDPTHKAGPEGQLSEDFHVSVDFESLFRDAVRLHRSRVLEPPHLDHLDHELDFLLLQIPFQIPTERLGVRDHGIDVFLEGDVNGFLPVDQALHQELQRERGLAGPERTEDRDDVPRGHASTEHLVEPIDPGEDEPFLDPFVRCIPLIVVTRSLTSTRSEIARSVRESMTTIESCAFSSRKVTSSSRMFVAGRSNTSACSVHDAGTTLCRKYVLEKSLKTVWSRNAR